MKAGWKNRIDEQRYFEEKKARAKEKPKLNAYEQTLFEKQQDLMHGHITLPHIQAKAILAKKL